MAAAAGMPPDLMDANVDLDMDDLDIDMPLDDLDLSGLPDPVAGAPPAQAQSGYPPSQPSQAPTPTQRPPRPPQQQQQRSHEDSSAVDSNNAFAQASHAGGTMAGAGPLPTGFNTQPGATTGSTLTEFTKRRNWSQRVLEEIRDLLHILSADGRVVYASPSCKQLTGWDPAHLVGKFIVEFIHQDDGSLFVREFNESIASGNPLRFFYRFRREDGSVGIFEAHGHPHVGSELVPYGPQAGSQLCRGFFMMSRPYPTKNAALLDSFLEHKIENERLTKRIAELRREEREEQEQQEQQWQQKQQEGGVVSDMTSPDSQRTETRPGGGGAFHAMPPPAKPGLSNTALTRQNLDEALAASRPDSITDKMARFEAGTHYDTIEMLTGLRYRDGERSQGISTGDTSPALIRGDAGIAILVDKDGRGGGGAAGAAGDKKKKLKVADEYVCTDCGTLDSPEWRKGPGGPKTLCNACGLRWAKKEKKRQNTGGGNPPPATTPMPMSVPGNAGL